MEPVIYKNGEFMEIVIPANTEITSEMLLSKYGIHAVIEDSTFVGGGGSFGGGSFGGETSNLTYPYAFFHWFFSFFTLSNKGETKVETSPIVDETKVDETSPIVGDKSPIVDETKVDETKVDETTPIVESPDNVDDAKVDDDKTAPIVESPDVVETPIVETDPSETKVDDETAPSDETPDDETALSDTSLSGKASPSVDTPSDETPVDDETKVGETQVDESPDDVDSKKDSETPVVDNSKSKYMKIIIKSIDGVRSWQKGFMYEGIIVHGFVLSLCSKSLF